MKLRIFGLSVALSASFGNAFGASPVTKVQWEQNPATSQVTVTYDLGGTDAAVVTLDVQTNGVSIGQANVTRTVGDCNRLVSPGTGKTIYWRPDYDWENHVFGEDEITCRVVAWPKWNPPDYMAVDLVYTNNVRYFTCAENVPDGVTADIYKSRYLLMRRIHAAGQTFIMGTPASEAFRTGTGAAQRTHLDETPHPVSFTKDFYIGVYEVTKAQNAQLTATVPQTDLTPYSYTSWNTLDGRATAFREALGIGFGLPTEAQWEFACRAGTDTSVNDLSELDGTKSYNTKPSMMNEVAITAADGGGKAPVKVGQFKPNAWGLYDMHGNADEVCSDWVDTTKLSTAAVVDPTGLESGTMKAVRGGVSYFWPTQARSGARYAIESVTTSGAGMGVRLACPAVAVR